MTTKVKPLSSGAFANVSLDGLGRADHTDATLTGLPTAALHAATQAVNEWHNAGGGTGDHATAAKKRANAAGIDLQEV